MIAQQLKNGRASATAQAGAEWTGKPLEAKLEDRTMSTSEGIQKRNAFAAVAAFRLQGLEWTSRPVGLPLWMS
jgi:hypothetical protein